jgi:hypothetical protein
MISDVIKITSLKAGLLPEDLALLERCEAMIPSDWMALYQNFGSGTLSDHLAVFAPLDFTRSHWPFENRGDELGRLRMPHARVRLPWIDKGMLTLGKCDWGWVTTGLPGTKELRLHPSRSQEAEEGVEAFASLGTCWAVLPSFRLSVQAFPRRPFSNDGWIGVRRVFSLTMISRHWWRRCRQ